MNPKIKRKLNKTFIKVVSFILVVAWLFSGWPGIRFTLLDMSFPPKIGIALAAVDINRPGSNAGASLKTTDDANARDSDPATFSSTEYEAKHLYNDCPLGDCPHDCGAG